MANRAKTDRHGWKMRDQIYKVENAEPENAGAENAGLEIAGLEIAEPKAQRWKMKPPPRASM